MENEYIQQLKGDMGDINKIKKKFGFGDIEVNEEVSNCDYFVNSSLSSMHSSKNDDSIKSDQSCSFIISAQHKKVQQIMYQSIKKNKNEKEKGKNKGVFISENYNINAIVNMIHSNYNNMVEYDDDNDNKSNNNKTTYSSSSSSLNNHNILSRRTQMNFLCTPYKFIYSPKEEMQHIDQKISIRKFNQLHDECIYRILYNIFNQYDTILSSSSFIADKVVLSLNHLFNHSIELYKYTYKSLIELQEFYFKYSQIKKGKYIYPLFDLYLRSKIIEEVKENMNYEITFCYKFIATSKIKESHQENYVQTIKFDIKKKGECSYWFASEFQENKDNIGRLCHSQIITPFASGDNILFRINIFNVDGYMIPSSLEWKEMLCYPIKNPKADQYQKTIMKSNIVYDRLRCCEIEHVVHQWKNAEHLIKKKTIEDFALLIVDHFNIIDIQYDIMKVYIYKFRLQAKTIGFIPKNIYTNSHIEIIEEDGHLMNECQWMSCLNVKNETERIQIRKGEYVLFYITDLYY